MTRSMIFAGSFIGALLFAPSIVSAHCDTYSGPVIEAAKQALDKNDVTFLLKWIPKEDEPLIKAAFNKTIKVRSKGADVKELADTYFFETLVRVHRAGEGAPYTGIKNIPAEKIVTLSDKALETGNIDTLASKITAHLIKGLRERHAKVIELKKLSDNNVEAGREYVEAYVNYMHFIETIHTAIASEGEQHEPNSDSNGKCANHKD